MSLFIHPVQRKKSFLCYGLKINGIVDILNCTLEPIRYSQLVMKSQIRLKKSFTNYLKFCTEKGLVRNWKKSAKIAGCCQSWFIISEKGREFLEMVK